MAISTSFDESRNLTVFTAEGNLTFDEQIIVLREFYAGKPTPNVIWDFRSAVGERISAQEIMKIIEFIKSHGKSRPGGKTALVAGDSLSFGLSRMGQAYADNENVPWEMKAFRSMDEAIRWIEEK
jgi:hypothetical protein